MKRLPLLLGLALALATLFLAYLAGNTPSTQAQGPLPPNNPSRGLIYDGLETAGGSPHGLYKLKLPPGRGPFYTHGPDAAPLGVNLTKKQPRGVLAFAAAGGTTPSNGASLSGPLNATVVCDGDGNSGNRVQVIYAYQAGSPDNYSTYLASIQQWAADADAEYENSAEQMGGSRHLRYVTDVNCAPVVLDVRLSSTGAATFGNTISDLIGQGFNHTDRKYIVFVDATVYCGIGSVAADDQPGLSNQNNKGPGYGRIDTGCWNGQAAAHELMHGLGAVQLSAPHSDGSWHCTDGHDNLCDGGGLPLPTPYPCGDPSGYYLLDCNHDDYFSTNPPAGSYLATHWNTANSVFLIAGSAPPPTLTATSTPPATATSLPPSTNTPTAIATETPLPPTAAPTNTPIPPPNDTPVPPTSTPFPPTATSLPPTATPAPPTNTPPPTATPTQGSVIVNVLTTGQMVKGKFAPTSKFTRNNNVYVQGHVVDQNGNNLSGATVSMSLLTPGGSVYCTFSAISASDGNALGSCKVSRSAPAGTWDAHVNSAGMEPILPLSVTDTTFTEQ